MSATTLARLAEHIADNDLPWRTVSDGTSNLRVQLGRDPEGLIRWVSILGAVVWNVQDCRHPDDGDGFWAIEAVGGLDGDVRVWCDVPPGFAATEQAVIDRMTGVTR